MAELLALSLFGAGYLAITLEHRIFVNKAAASLLLAVGLWLLTVFVQPAAQLEEHLAAVGSDIFGLIIFLLTAMTLVEVLVHYHLFDVVESALRSRGWTRRDIAWGIVAITFGLSAVLANMTVAIVMIQVARKMFPKRELLPVAALVVIASNSGGAFSPIGDVTTLMLWFAHRFSSLEVILQGFLPSLVTILVPAWLVLRAIPREAPGEASADCYFKPSRSDKAVISVALGAFALPIFSSLVHLPPYMGLLAGLGLVWVCIDFAKRARPQDTHLDANIHRFLQRTDIESLEFFVGILLAVGALHALGVLDELAHFFLGSTPTITRLFGAFIGLGGASAIVDNVPVTAAAIGSLTNVASSLWVLLAVMVGTGGSLLIIGSASGVVAMGMIRELTFHKYMKLVTWPALAGFLGAAAVWWLQLQIFG